MLWRSVFMLVSCSISKCFNLQKMEENNEQLLKLERKNERNASDKHKELANYIKEFHIRLQSDSKKYGAEKAWKMHLEENDKLKFYAKSMFELATSHWTNKSDTSVPLTYCRIEWIKKQCKDYFFEGGIKRFDDKERFFLSKDNKQKINVDDKNISTSFGSKINVLDVGSCYNPFSTEDLFSVTAIDLTPYSKDVTKCDFLNLQVDSTERFSEDETLIEMPKNSYDAVIFSLLLEYIPCPNQRFLCCKKAYDLLNEGGVLFIATPDSKHEGANRKIINTSWKVVMAKLGFMRIKYEKLQHIHCLIFRKCFYKEAAMRTIDWKKIPEDEELFTSMKIFIPRDFQKSDDESNKIDSVTYKHDDKELMDLFDQLPCES